ncbi:precorrin-3B C(17)-methyltransferase [Methanosalsum natronophilum]|nr:precorrin-3B C(17)-methyltransferase [Methanosalsum natronophilum]MCS3924228.1 precorrin-3B C17-methyltransferase [Methanosalsum natronophilum]
MQSQNKTNKNGRLYIVGIGPGSIDHMTVKACDVLKRSDCIIGNGTYLDQISDFIEGQEIIRSSMGKEVDRATRAVKLSQNKEVSIISGGDANVYGMAGLVLEVAEKTGLDVDIEVVPGVTAITAAASILGAPIVNDFATISLSDLLTPWEMIEKRLDAAASSDFVISLYNPKSRQRKSNFSKAIDIIKKHRDPSVPVGLVKNALRGNDEDTVVTTLEEVLNYNDWVDMSTTILVTNSESRIWENNGTKRIITPRGYHRKYEY